MYKLVQFILKHLSVIYFLMLSGASLVLIYSQNHYHKTTFLSGYKEISGRYFSMIDKSKEYFALKQENRALIIENRKLRESNKNVFEYNTPQIKTILDSGYIQKYTYIEAKVIDFSLNRDVNFFMLNRGKKHGIQKEMGVISDQGVVGVVFDVSENFSSVIALLNKGKADFYGVVDKTGYAGRISWRSQNIQEVSLLEIPQKSKVEIANKVLTGRASSVFPQGIPIGEIIKIEEPQGELFYDIILKPSVNFSKLNNVYVVQNMYKPEQDSLKQKFLQAFN